MSEQAVLEQPILWEEQRAVLDAALEEAAKVVREDALSMEAMLGLPTPLPLGVAWPDGDAFYQSPKLKAVRDLSQALGILAGVVPQTYDDLIVYIDRFARIAQMLIRLREPDGTWRQPTLDEIQSRYELQELREVINRMLVADKFIEEVGSPDADPGPEGNQ